MSWIPVAIGAAGLSSAGSSGAARTWAESHKVAQDVQHEIITNRSVLKPGDTIGVKGSVSSGILEYQHLGIYLGHDEVVDYINDSKVRRIKLIVFTHNNTRELCRIHYIKAPTALEPNDIMEKALRKFKNQDFGSYDVITNNCEHFATFCTFGKRFSFQVAKTVRATASSCV